jgi:regulator of RNase E activity RraB
LALDIVEAADVLGKCTLEGAQLAVEVAELDQAELAEGVDYFAADFVGNVELDHAHIRRAERRVACRSHRDGWGWAMTTAMEDSDDGMSLVVEVRGADGGREGVSGCNQPIWRRLRLELACCGPGLAVME